MYFSPPQRIDSYTLLKQVDIYRLLLQNLVLILCCSLEKVEQECRNGFIVDAKSAENLVYKS